MKPQKNQLEILARLLPGDVIHDEAPCHKLDAPTQVVLSNIDAANAKRARKMEKARKEMQS